MLRGGRSCGRASRRGSCRCRGVVARRSHGGGGGGSHREESHKSQPAQINQKQKFKPLTECREGRETNPRNHDEHFECSRRCFQSDLRDAAILQYLSPSRESTEVRVELTLLSHFVSFVRPRRQDRAQSKSLRIYESQLVLFVLVRSHDTSSSFSTRVGRTTWNSADRSISQIYGTLQR